MSVAPATVAKGGRLGLWAGGLALVVVALLVLGALIGSTPGEGADTGAHALSRSAVGYAGVVRLLRAEGRDVRIWTGPSKPGERPQGLVVLTPSTGISEQEAAVLAEGRRVLMVAPKWVVVPDPKARSTRVLRLARGFPGVLAPAAALAPSLRAAEHGLAFHPGVARLQITVTGRNDPFGGRSFATGPIDSARAFKSPAIEPLLTAEGLGPVLGVAHDRSVYVLSEPDLLNNQGIADLDTARAGVRLIEGLAGGGPITFDVTLAGLSRRVSPLRPLVVGRYAGAGLGMVGAAAWLAWLALARFGAPTRPERVYAFGKRALADSAASLLAYDRREPRLAGRFAELVRGQALRALAASPAPREAEDALLDRAAEAAGAQPWTRLAANPHAATRAELMTLARRLHDWKTEVTLGRG